MIIWLRRLRALAALGVMFVVSSPALAQAFTAPQGIGSVTLSWQYVDNTGHRFTDGYLLERGESVTTSLLLEGDYAITDRLTATAAIPFVFAKYTGDQPPPSRLPVDACGCWHSGFQDYILSARYRFGDESRALTPIVRYVRPSHDYEYQGEAVVGRRLQELQIGVNAGARLDGKLRNLSLEAGYAYSFVEKPLPDVSINRSNGYFNLGYMISPRFFVQGFSIFNATHGGLRIGSPTGDPFFPPGELDTPEKFAQRDRVLSTQYWQLGAGVAYAAGPVDIFVSATRYVWGRNAHNGQAYTAGLTWFFDVSKDRVVESASLRR